MCAVKAPARLLYSTPSASPPILYTDPFFQTLSHILCTPPSLDRFNHPDKTSPSKPKIRLRIFAVPVACPPCPKRLVQRTTLSIFVFVFVFVCAPSPAFAEHSPAARPPPLDTNTKNTSPSTPWEHHADIGADLALVTRLATRNVDGTPNSVRYEPALGYGARIDWSVIRNIRFNAYLLAARHPIGLPVGALDQDSATLSADRTATYSFGARLCPNIAFTPHVSSFLCAGIGWGRFEFGRMQIQLPDRPAFEVRERSTSFAEVPIGLGTRIGLIPRWLALHAEIATAFHFGQEGSASRGAQAIDAQGQIHHIGALPIVDVSFYQIIGLSLLL